MDHRSRARRGIPNIRLPRRFVSHDRRLRGGRTTGIAVVPLDVRHDDVDDAVARPGGFARSLWAVSCPSALSCTAAGEQTDASGFVPLTYSNVAAGQTRTVTVSWDASESARLGQLAAHFGESPAATQKRSVYLLSFLLGFLPPTPQPQVLPPPGTTTTVVSVWDAGEFSVIDTVAKKYVLSDSDATRLSFSILSFLLGLGGI